jgi:hypothetical protein
VAPAVPQEVKGDRIEVLVDIGDGVRSFEITARRAGRRVEASVARGQVEVVELTRSGKAVRSARFMAARVVAIVEHPTSDSSADSDEERAPDRRRRPPPQDPLFQAEGQ